MAGQNEAHILSKYLIGKPCPPKVEADYNEAIQKLGVNFTDYQNVVWQKMLNSRFWMRAMDAGLAFVFPSSVLRKRIFIMLSLLEADKENTDNFLPVKRSVFYVIPLGLRVFRAGLMAGIGILMVKVHKID